MDSVTIVLFIAGFVLLIIGADFLVRGASRLAVAAGISPLVVGLTVVAYGTSAPELAVSLQSGFAGHTDLMIGNVVGSNIANILLILGIASVISPLVVAQQLIRLDVPLMIMISVGLLLTGLDGRIGRLEGLLLASGAVTYTIFSVVQSRKEKQVVQEAYATEFDGGPPKTSLKEVVLQLGLIGLGLFMLVTGARWLISGAVTVATLLGVSQLVIGLTVVAVGTSLPEIATSMIASFRNKGDIAVGNAVGSNIFNILLVLGVAALVLPNGIPVATSAIHFDIPLMIAVAIACLPIFFTGYTIARWEGFLFLGYYITYTLYLVLNATHYSSLPAFNTVMLVFVIPLTVVTIAISVVRHIRAAQPALTSLPSQAEAD